MQTGTALGLVLASKMASKIMKKRLRQRSRNGADFGTHFKKILGPVLAPKMAPKSGKKRSGSDPKMGPILEPALRRFSRSTWVGLTECWAPGGDYRGGAGSRLKAKVWVFGMYWHKMNLKGISDPMSFGTPLPGGRRIQVVWHSDRPN